jgi:hypothetical protein
LWIPALSLLGCSSSEPSGARPSADASVEEDAAVVPPRVELGRHAVALVETRQIIPGPGLPAEAPPQTSNNNLDVVRHDGRVYLAWRTGPNHYASAETVLYVLSSADEKTWRFEAKVKSDADLREPRWLSFGGKLRLWLARLGNDPNRFEPKGASFVERNDDGTWAARVDCTVETCGALGASNFIPWRAKVERGVPYLTAYDRGERIYAPNGDPVRVHLFTTTDGRVWRDVDPKTGPVLNGGGSETDFAIGDDGALFAVSRNEAGDATGLGAKVCRASKGALGAWTCTSDPKKYDSPLMFWHDGEAYLLGRRNLSPTGSFDLEENRDRPLLERWFKAQVDYKNWPKRCALWRYVQGEDRIAFIADLPSRGDTCFPGMLPGATPDDIVVYDYSSPIDGADVPWNEGQIGPTRIYRHVLRFTRR